MKKLIIALGVSALVLFGCAEQEAEAVEIQNNINVSAGNFNAGFDQDGNEFSVGFGALSFNQSDTVDIGVEVSLTLLYDEGTAPGSNVTIDGVFTYDYTTDGDSIVGIETPVSLLGLVTTPTISWNINDSEIDGSLKNTFDIMGGTLSSKFMLDLDDFDYTGSEFGLAYDWNMSDSITITPYVDIPYNDDWDRQEIVAGLGFYMALN